MEHGDKPFAHDIHQQPETFRSMVLSQTSEKEFIPTLWPVYVICCID